jgi:hypothetical protein
MIRELHRTKDRKGVEAIDTAFETSSVFDMVTAAAVDRARRAHARDAARQALLDR